MFPICKIFDHIDSKKLKTDQVVLLFKSFMTIFHNDIFCVKVPSYTDASVFTVTLPIIAGVCGFVVWGTPG